MIKKIKFNEIFIEYDTETQDGFETILKMYDRKIKRMVSSWVKNIPDHDIDDLAQVCRMKLVEALDKYNDKSNINFSTYVYTVWHRKLSQLSYKYKTKKHSAYIAGDNYVSNNYAMDKLTNSFYLMLGKHKCPISKKMINLNTCRGCEFSCGYENKIIKTGTLKGEIKQFTKCSYLNKILSQRGTRHISINQPIKNNGVLNRKESTLEKIIPDRKNESINVDLTIELDKISLELDEETFIILQLLLDGMNKSEIINKMKISNSRLKKHFSKLRNNKKIQSLVSKV
jgi:RNA polymerase sigma factor (sigma-70 family)